MVVLYDKTLYSATYQQTAELVYQKWYEMGRALQVKIRSGSQQKFLVVSENNYAPSPPPLPPLSVFPNFVI